MKLNFNGASVIYGGPGTGKTERLIGIVEEELSAGIAAASIAYVSFTKRAVYEARQRAIDKFDLVQDDMDGFRTVHSMAYAGVHVTRGSMMTGSDYDEVGALLGLNFTVQGAALDIVPPTAADSGNGLRHLYSLARAEWVSPLEAWEKYGRGIDWWVFLRYVQTLEQYKEDTQKVDFADLLHLYAMQGTVRDYTVGVIDEAQDLSAAQWHVLQRAFQNCARVYIAGDDDQSINTWAGADPKTFRAFSHNADVKVEILHQSYRVPCSVFNVAQRVLHRIHAREKKRYTATGAEGRVIRLGAVAHAPLAEGDWLILARNHYHLTEIFSLVRARGLAYRTQDGSSIDAEHIEIIKTWERLRAGSMVDGASIRSAAAYTPQSALDLEDEELYTAEQAGLNASKIWHDALVGIPAATRAYYLTIRRNGGLLNAPPRILLSTIHGAKGAEAENVLLLTDTSRRAVRAMEIDPDAEHRVWYVGVTRARDTLYIVAPQGRNFYPIPLQS